MYKLNSLKTLAVSLLIPATLVVAAPLPPAFFGNRIVACRTGACPTLAGNIGAGATFTGTIAGTTASVDATSESAPGIFKSYASYSATGSVGTYYQLNAGGQVFDVLTIDAPGMTGQVGYLFPIYTVTGSAIGSASAQINMWYQDSFGAGAQGQLQTYFPTGPGTFSFGPLPFHFGSPFGFGTAFGAILYLAAGGSGTADFDSTAILSGLPVFSDQGGVNPVQGVTYGRSELGQTYTANGVTPEPGSLLLIASGVGLIILKRRSTRK